MSCVCVRPGVIRFHFLQLCKTASEEDEFARLMNDVCVIDNCCLLPHIIFVAVWSVTLTHPQNITLFISGGDV